MRTKKKSRRFRLDSALPRDWARSFIRNLLKHIKNIFFLFFVHENEWDISAVRRRRVSWTANIRIYYYSNNLPARLEKLKCYKWNLCGWKLKKKWTKTKMKIRWIIYSILHYERCYFIWLCGHFFFLARLSLKRWCPTPLSEDKRFYEHSFISRRHV